MSQTDERQAAMERQLKHAGTVERELGECRTKLSRAEEQVRELEARNQELLSEMACKKTLDLGSNGVQPGTAVASAVYDCPDLVDQINKQCGTDFDRERDLFGAVDFLLYWRRENQKSLRKIEIVLNERVSQLVDRDKVIRNLQAELRLCADAARLLDNARAYINLRWWHTLVIKWEDEWTAAKEKNELQEPDDVDAAVRFAGAPELVPVPDASESGTGKQAYKIRWFAVDGESEARIAGIARRCAAEFNVDEWSIVQLVELIRAVANDEIRQENLRDQERLGR